jgi:polyisoprenoid-binding protein YceI
MTMRWQIDPSHTSVDFAVRHLGISTVRGVFNDLSGTLEATDEGVLTSVEVTIDAASIHTRDQKRDDHLRSPDFLDAARYATLTFRSTSVTAQGTGKYLVKGDLTVRGQTRPMSFDVEVSAPITDPWGNVRAAATAEGKLNRRDWGLTWNQTLEFGALVVGDEVRFRLEVEAVAKTPAAVR